MTAARVEAVQAVREVVAEAGIPTASIIRGREGERQVSVGGTAIQVEQYVGTDAKMHGAGVRSRYFDYGDPK